MQAANERHSEIWLITVGEPLPCDEGESRLLRTGILARTLASRGHRVTWWTSSFDHVRKRHRFSRDHVYRDVRNLSIRLMRTIGYSRNISLRRLVDHMYLARRFRASAVTAPRPDLIVCSLPTIELACEAARYAQDYDIPLIVDIRDLWPDIFYELAPKGLRWLASPLLLPMQKGVECACKGAAGIIGNSPYFVDWGVRNAERVRTERDRTFPFGYDAEEPAAADLSAAEQFWRERGVGGGNELLSCFFGTLGRQFDLETVIGAAKVLEQRYPSRFKFVICGTGDRFEHYRALARESASIVMPGWIDRPRIWSLLRKADVGLAPYRSSVGFRGNLPNKPIEYWSAGLPVLSSLDGYLADLLRDHDCGITYRNGDVDGLVSALACFDSSRNDLRRMSENAASLYAQDFQASAVYGALAEYLEDTIGQKLRHAQ